MIRHGQFLSQKQTLSQKLSPQQIQYIKLLQLPTLALEQRIKEEMEQNPVLEEMDSFDESQITLQDSFDDSNPELAREKEEKEASNEKEESPLEEIETNEEIGKIDDDDWDELLHADETESYKAPLNPDLDEIRDLPKPYYESLLEELENQVQLLKLNEREEIIASEILGSLDDDGYLRRDIQAIIDTIAFNYSKLVMEEEIEHVLKQIQRLDPPGIAARDLRECLLIQLELTENSIDGKNLAYKILKNDWDLFEKKHFAKLIQKYHCDEEDIKAVYSCVRQLDPRPGLVETPDSLAGNYVIPDFDVKYVPGIENEETGIEEEGDFLVTLNQRNAPSLRISPHYRDMWNDIKNKKSTVPEIRETQTFIKAKIDSAKWFIDSIRQRQQTLMNVMQTIVALQADFFKSGEGMKPMILKDVSDRIGMDISTISRVTNGKYVQTVFGVFELKYFFNEKMETESGKMVANLELKDMIGKIIAEEDKLKPLSDQEIVEEMKKRGFPIARRTVTKYREEARLPVARLRKHL
ncbi:MAG: RNA polymerase factor sigma-54 [Bacteroidetes bacterium]|nr:RNA polymerase factor sigma-54 [Bacteroidota bacterium]